MKTEQLPPRLRSPEPIQWPPGSLGALYPRVEALFRNAAAIKRQEEVQRCVQANREVRARKRAARRGSLPSVASSPCVPGV